MRRGQSLVVWAIREGRQCARAVDEYLMGVEQPAALIRRRHKAVDLSYTGVVSPVDVRGPEPARSVCAPLLRVEGAVRNCERLGRFCVAPLKAPRCNKSRPVWGAAAVVRGSPLKATDIGRPDYFHKVVDCQWACPAHTPVPEYISLIADRRYTDAYMINWKSNVFPGILGRTCDRPCEPACRRGRVEEEPVAICRLKRVAADNKSDITALLPKVAPKQRQEDCLHRRRASFPHSCTRPRPAGL
jgi:hypothetical protein